MIEHKFGSGEGGELPFTEFGISYLQKVAEKSRKQADETKKKLVEEGLELKETTETIAAVEEFIGRGELEGESLAALQGFLDSLKSYKASLLELINAHEKLYDASSENANAAEKTERSIRDKYVRPQ